MTDRYTKAIEQLGSDKLDVRIGGIYAMERVARDSARDHPTVMEVLTAFIREHSRDPWQPDKRGHLDNSTPMTRPDVHAALTVIGRRDSNRDRRQINLVRSNLNGAYLRGAHLAGATFFQADLTSTIFVEANLARAVFFGANLARANLVRANLRGANLRGAQLTDAKLSGADLTDADLRDSVLTGADLTDTNLTGAWFPTGATVPEGWACPPGSGRLARTGVGPSDNTATVK